VHLGTSSSPQRTIADPTSGRKYGAMRKLIAAIVVLAALPIHAEDPFSLWMRAVVEQDTAALRELIANYHYLQIFNALADQPPPTSLRETVTTIAFDSSPSAIFNEAPAVLQSRGSTFVAFRSQQAIPGSADTTETSVYVAVISPEGTTRVSTILRDEVLIDELRLLDDAESGPRLFCIVRNRRPRSFSSVSPDSDNVVEFRYDGSRWSEPHVLLRKSFEFIDGFDVAVEKGGRLDLVWSSGSISTGTRTLTYETCRDDRCHDSNLTGRPGVELSEPRFILARGRVAAITAFGLTASKSESLQLWTPRSRWRQLRDLSKQFQRTLENDQVLITEEPIGDRTRMIARRVTEYGEGAELMSIWLPMGNWAPRLIVKLAEPLMLLDRGQRLILVDEKANAVLAGDQHWISPVSVRSRDTAVEFFGVALAPAPALTISTMLIPEKRPWKSIERVVWEGAAGQHSLSWGQYPTDIGEALVKAAAREARKGEIEDAVRVYEYLSREKIGWFSTPDLEAGRLCGLHPTVPACEERRMERQRTHCELFPYEDGCLGMNQERLLERCRPPFHTTGQPEACAEVGLYEDPFLSRALETIDYALVNAGIRERFRKAAVDEDFEIEKSFVKGSNFETLATLLRDPDPRVKFGAARAIYRADHSRALPFLIGLITDRSGFMSRHLSDFMAPSIVGEMAEATLDSDYAISCRWSGDRPKSFMQRVDKQNFYSRCATAP